MRLLAMRMLLLGMLLSSAVAAGPDAGSKERPVPRVDPTEKACSWAKAKDAVTCLIPGETPVCIIDKYDGKNESGGWGCAPKK